jgi:TonB family protein
MVSRVIIILCLAIIVFLGGLATPTTSAPEATPARGTIEYAKRHALYAPRPYVPAYARHLSGTGLFAMQIRPDGTVSNVQTLQSTGHADLDAASIAALSKWRFYPGQFKVVRIPLTYMGRR